MRAEVVEVSALLRHEAFAAARDAGCVRTEEAQGLFSLAVHTAVNPHSTLDEVVRSEDMVLSSSGK